LVTAICADSNEDERQKLLGQKFVLVVIDEAQAFGRVDDLDKHQR
jgi:hypothetical protein